MLWNEDQLPRVKKGKKAYVERKVRECFQLKTHGQCSKEDSCCFSHDRLVRGDLYGGQRRKDDRPLPHQIRRPRLTAREKSSKTSGNTDESSSDKRSQIPCRYTICKKKKTVM